MKNRQVISQYHIQLYFASNFLLSFQHDFPNYNQKYPLVYQPKKINANRLLHISTSISLSLIESFYKAGMNSDLILNTVNKLLSINTEDSFTALDVSVIDLENKSADFIKYGAPYGFIINDGAVKIIEGNTLPLGILEDLSPSVAKTEVYDGDMILLLTDGISDAFKSSSAIIDFLRSVPAKNPQTLTNQILSKAVALNDGKHLDDMTALAVRIFKNN
jgi:stage II sporulation protein E